MSSRSVLETGGQD